MIRKKIAIKAAKRISLQVYWTMLNKGLAEVIKADTRMAISKERVQRKASRLQVKIHAQSDNELIILAAIEESHPIAFAIAIRAAYRGGQEVSGVPSNSNPFPSKKDSAPTIYLTESGETPGPYLAVPVQKIIGPIMARIARIKMCFLKFLSAWFSIIFNLSLKFDLLVFFAFFYNY